MDIDPDIALRRVTGRDSNGTDIFEKKSFLERVREIYFSITDERFVILNGDAMPDEILNSIIRDLEKGL